jgi:D-glycero-alpha-D-manno-heptose 1-phosphate guanylyltransferase
VDRGRVTEAVILAGGLGTRLRGVLPDVPKSLAPVRGVPFLHYLLDWLERQGVTRVVVSTGYMADAVEREVNRYPGELDVFFSREHAPLGTGGAIYRALRCVKGTRAFVLNGDTYFPANLADYASQVDRAGAGLALALRRVEDASRYGCVEVRDRRIERLSEKGVSGAGLVNAGLYLLPRNLVERVPMPEAFSWETDFLQPKAVMLGIAGIVIEAPFVDIGTPESYAEAESILPPLLA